MGNTKIEYTRKDNVITVHKIVIVDDKMNKKLLCGDIPNVISKQERQSDVRSETDDTY